MQRSVLLFILFIFLKVTIYSLPAKADSTLCLQIEGIIENIEDGTGEACIVEIITPDMKIDTLLLKEGKRKFRCNLQKNRYYSIRITKKGYVSKLICANTEMQREPAGIYRFSFSTRLISRKMLHHLNKEAFDFPVAIIYFDQDQEVFSYNKEYTSAIKKEMGIHTRTILY